MLPEIICHPANMVQIPNVATNAITPLTVAGNQPAKYPTVIPPKIAIPKNPLIQRVGPCRKSGDRLANGSKMKSKAGRQPRKTRDEEQRQANRCAVNEPVNRALSLNFLLETRNIVGRNGWVVQHGENHCQ
jgi:hypothetical protein